MMVQLIRDRLMQKNTPVATNNQSTLSLNHSRVDMPQKQLQRRTVTDMSQLEGEGEPLGQANSFVLPTGSGLTPTDGGRTAYNQTLNDQSVDANLNLLIQEMYEEPGRNYHQLEE